MAKKYAGYTYFHVSKELNLSYRTIQGLVRNGLLKLNDDDKIDEEYYIKFKKEWDSKPDWMKRKI